MRFTLFRKKGVTNKLKQGLENTSLPSVRFDRKRVFGRIYGSGKTRILTNLTQCSFRLYFKRFSKVCVSGFKKDEYTVSEKE